MKKRIRKSAELHKGQPGKQSPVKRTCPHGHELWVNPERKTIRCPICRGKK